MAKRIDEQYLSDGDILERVLDAEQQVEEACEDLYEGLISPVIIKGPPGTGKSELIERTSINAGMKSIDIINSDYEKPSKDDIDGGMSSYPYHLVNKREVDGMLIRGADYNTWGLVGDLFGNNNMDSDKDTIGGIFLDDNDTILMDETAVAILMKATEQKSVKSISYAKAASTHELQLRGVPGAFECNTPIVIATNIDMRTQVELAHMKEEEASKPGKKPYVMPTHLKRWSALMDRGLYIDVGMNTPRSIRVYCEHKIKKVNMLTESKWLEETYGRCLTKKENDIVMKWIRERQGQLAQPLSLRTYNSVAGVYIKRNKTFEKSAQTRFLRSV